MLFAEKRFKKRFTFLVTFPLVLWVIDHFLFHDFFSKYELSYASGFITFIWLYFLVTYNKKIKKRDEFNTFMTQNKLNEFKKYSLSLISVLIFGLLCFFEFNRFMALSYTLLNGNRHTMSVDVIKSHPGGKSTCSGRGKLDFELAHHDPFFGFCLTDQQDITFPQGHSNAKFDVVESPLGILFLDAKRTAS